MNSHTKTYLVCLSGSCIFILITVATLNFIIDPAAIYWEKNYNESKYAVELLRSKEGLSLPNNILNQRKIKFALAQNITDHDCIVIGSSHVMMMSSDQRRRTLHDECNKLMNLGVAGSSLEDYIVLSQVSVERKKKLKVIFGIDPWSLDFNRDTRWLIYRHRYEEIVYGMKTGSQDTGTLITNLINLSYTLRSIGILINNTDREIIEIPHVDIENGHIQPAMLPDGSYVYSSKYITEKAFKQVPIGGSNYKAKLEGNTNEKAIAIFKQHISNLLSIGAEVVFLMVPYHPNVLAGKSLESSMLQEMEPVVHAIAETLNIPVLGSYDPFKVGCLANEFYDYMHPASSCLAKIRYKNHQTAIR